MEKDNDLPHVIPFGSSLPHSVHSNPPAPYVIQPAEEVQEDDFVMLGPTGILGPRERPDVRGTWAGDVDTSDDALVIDESSVRTVSDFPDVNDSDFPQTFTAADFTEDLPSCSALLPDCSTNISDKIKQHTASNSPQLPSNTPHSGHIIITPTPPSNTPHSGHIIITPTPQSDTVSMVTNTVPAPRSDDVAIVQSDHQRTAPHSGEIDPNSVSELKSKPNTLEDKATITPKDDLKVVSKSPRELDSKTVTPADPPPTSSTTKTDVPKPDSSPVGCVPIKSMSCKPNSVQITFNVNDDVYDDTEPIVPKSVQQTDINSVNSKTDEILKVNIPQPNEDLNRPSSISPPLNNSDGTPQKIIPVKSQTVQSVSSTLVTDIITPQKINPVKSQTVQSVSNSMVTDIITMALSRPKQQSHESRADKSNMITVEIAPKPKMVSMLARPSSDKSPRPEKNITQFVNTSNNSPAREPSPNNISPSSVPNANNRPPSAISVNSKSGSIVSDIDSIGDILRNRPNSALGEQNADQNRHPSNSALSEPNAEPNRHRPNSALSEPNVEQNRHRPNSALSEPNVNQNRHRPNSALSEPNADQNRHRPNSALSEQNADQNRHRPSSAQSVTNVDQINRRASSVLTDENDEYESDDTLSDNDEWLEDKLQNIVNSSLLRLNKLKGDINSAKDHSPPKNTNKSQNNVTQPNKNTVGSFTEKLEKSKHQSTPPSSSKLKVIRPKPQTIQPKRVSNITKSKPDTAKPARRRKQKEPMKTASNKTDSSPDVQGLTKTPEVSPVIYGQQVVTGADGNQYVVIPRAEFTSVNNNPTGNKTAPIVTSQGKRVVMIAPIDDSGSPQVGQGPGSVFRPSPGQGNKMVQLLIPASTPGVPNVQNIPKTSAKSNINPHTNNTTSSHNVAMSSKSTAIQKTTPPSTGKLFQAVIGGSKMSAIQPWSPSPQQTTGNAMKSGNTITIPSTTAPKNKPVQYVKHGSMPPGNTRNTQMGVNKTPVSLKSTINNTGNVMYRIKNTASSQNSAAVVSPFQKSLNVTTSNQITRTIFPTTLEKRAFNRKPVITPKPNPQIQNAVTLKHKKAGSPTLIFPKGTVSSDKKGKSPVEMCTYLGKDASRDILVGLNLPQRHIDFSKGDRRMDFYRCKGCQDEFYNKSSLTFHLSRQSLVICLLCPLCAKTLVFFNRCTFWIHVHFGHSKNLWGAGNLEYNVAPLWKSLMPSTDKNGKNGKLAVDEMIVIDGKQIINKNAGKTPANNIDEYVELSTDKERVTKSSSVENDQPSTSRASSVTNPRKNSSGKVAKIPASEKLVSEIGDNRSILKEPTPPASEHNANTQKVLKSFANLSIAMLDNLRAEFRYLVPCLQCNVNCKVLTNHLFKHYNHITKRVGKTFQCEDCGKILGNMCSLKAHRKIHGSDSPPFVCPECGQLFFCSKERFLVHVRTKCWHDAKEMGVECPVCRKLSASHRALQEHIGTHSETFYKCSFCPMAFLGMHKLKSHIKTEHPAQTGGVLQQICRCPLCDSVFKEITQLDTHITDHLKAQSFFVRYSCPHCPSTVPSFRMFMTHLNKVHKSKEKPPEMCSLCGKYFKTADQVSEHKQEDHKLYTDKIIIELPKDGTGFNDDYRQKQPKVKKQADDSETPAKIKKGRVSIEFKDPDSPLISKSSPGKRRKTSPAKNADSSQDSMIPAADIKDEPLDDYEGNSQQVGDSNSHGKSPAVPHPICAQCDMKLPSEAALEEHMKKHDYLARKRKARDENAKRDVKARDVSEKRLDQEPIPVLKIKKLKLDAHALTVEIKESKPKEKKGKGKGKSRAEKSKSDTEFDGVQVPTAPEPKKKYPCSECDERFAERHELQAHLKSEHAIMPIHVCQVCGQGYENPVHLDVHVKSVHEGKGKQTQWMCGICSENHVNAEFKKRTLLEKHLLMFHKLHKEYIDEFISQQEDAQKLDDGDSLDIAEKSNSPVKKLKVSGDTTYTCAKCDFKSEDYTKFSSHILRHKVDPDDFQCAECGLCFSVKPSLKRHLFMVHKITDFNKYKDEKGIDIENQHINESQHPMKATKRKVSASEQKTPKIPKIDTEKDKVETEKKNEKEKEKEEKKKEDDSLECKVCYKKFETEKELRSHSRVHGMAFIKSRRAKPPEPPQWFDNS